MIKLCFLNAYMISFRLSETFVFRPDCIWNDTDKIFLTGYSLSYMKHLYKTIVVAL